MPFSKFQQLPKELRLQIWEHTTQECRRIDLSTIPKRECKEIISTNPTAYRDTDYLFVVHGNKIPAILYINQESREVGRRVYAPLLTQTLKNKTFYFNFQIDVLTINDLQTVKLLKADTPSMDKNDFSEKAEMQIIMEKLQKLIYVGKKTNEVKIWLGKFANLTNLALIEPRTGMPFRRWRTVLEIRVDKFVIADWEEYFAEKWQKSLRVGEITWINQDDWNMEYRVVPLSIEEKQSIPIGMYIYQSDSDNNLM